MRNTPRPSSGQASNTKLQTTKAAKESSFVVFVFRILQLYYTSK